MIEDELCHVVEVPVQTLLDYVQPFLLVPEPSSKTNIRIYANIHISSFYYTARLFNTYNTLVAALPYLILVFPDRSLNVLVLLCFVFL